MMNRKTYGLLIEPGCLTNVTTHRKDQVCASIFTYYSCLLYIASMAPAYRIEFSWFCRNHTLSGPLGL
jgi:hypothetical protein